MILNINQLRAFYVAARLGSVTMAARELMVTPPAVTMQIRQLEKALEIRLMFRESNMVKLTEVGTKVFERAKSIFGPIKEMESFLDDLSASGSGLLRFGCHQSPARYIMPKLVTRFNKKYPGIRIIQEIGPTPELIAKVVSQQCELALIVPQPDEKRVRFKKVISEEVVLVAAAGSKLVPANEVSISQLANLPLAAHERGSALRRAIDHYLSRFSIRPKFIMELASLGLMKEIVSQDIALCLTEKFTVAKEVAGGELKLVRILEGTPTVDFGIAYLRRKNLSTSAWAFLRMLDESPIRSLGDMPVEKP